MRFAAFAIISISIGAFACNGSNFASGGKSGSKSGKSKGGADVDDKKDDKNDDDDAAKDAGDPNLPPNNAIDDNGVLKDDCVVSPILPDAPTALKQAFNWHASGPHPGFTQVMATPVVGRLVKSDKATTIVAPAFASCDYEAGGAYIYAINGADGTQKWVSDFLAVPSASAAIGDIDNSGDNEVVVFGSDGKTHALKADGSAKWVSAEVTGSGTRSYGGPIVVDLNGDGKVEVVAGNKVLKGTDGTTLFGLDGKGIIDNVVGDVNDSEGLEIVTGQTIFSAKGEALCHFPVSVEHQGIGRIRAGDDSMTVVGEAAGVVYAFNGKTCAKIFEKPFPGGGGGPFNFADFDGDGELNFGSAGKTNFAAYKPDGSTLWTSGTKDASSYQTGATTFDFNGDHKNEIVYNDEDYLRIYDGASGKVLYQIENSSGTLYEYPIIVDTDGDGHANIVVHANDCFNYTNKSAYGIRVFEAPKNDWVGTRGIWNQHAYDPLLVNDDGTLTGIDAEKIWKPWLKSKHLVGFRNNIAKPDIKPECK